MLIQRLGDVPQLDENYITELLGVLNRTKGGCDEIWLATHYGYPPLEKQKQTADTLVKTAARFRENGIRVSMQVSNTLGHGEYIGSKDCSGLIFEGSHAEHMVGADGEEAAYCFCPNGTHFIAYLTASLKEYARVRPDMLWFDDDMRLDNHSPVKFGCFCERCLSRFGVFAKKAYTREALVKAISEEIDVRETYVAYMRKVMYGFQYTLAKAFLEVSPDTSFGLQNCEHNYTGYGLSFLYDALRDASGKAPASRPGGGAYSDTNPNEIIDKYHILAIQNRALPSYVTEIACEIENTPDVRYGKSVGGTSLEATVYFAAGASSMAFATMMNNNEPLSWHEKELAAFSKQRTYWEALAKVNRVTHQGGAGYALSDNGWRRKSHRPFDFADYTFAARATDTEMTGIPFSFDQKADGVSVLRYENAILMSDEEIDVLLKRNVLCDGRSFRILEEKGCFDGARSSLIDADVTEDIGGYPWRVGTFTGADGYRLRLDGGVRPLGVWKDRNGKEYGHSAAVVRTKYGKEWAAFGCDPWNGIISEAKKKQIENAMDSISGNALCAVSEDGFKCTLFCRETEDKRTAAVSILNRSVGGEEGFTLRIRRPLGTKAYYMSQYDGEAVLETTVEGNELTVTVPHLHGWSVGTVFLYKV